jgi:hypothetical protein
MDLAELKFVVDTKELETAATRINELGTAVSKLNKPMQDLTKESAKTNKELSKAEEAAAKAALAQVKLEQAQTKSTQAAAKSSSVLERQNLILEYMAQGNSKGQASILATAKAAGALDDEMLELNKTLVTQRTLIGGDPFDKSIGLMQKLQNEYKTTTEVTNLFNKNLGLTEKQMTDLAREKERLIALYGIEGKSLDNLGAEYDQLIQKSAMINRANDARTNSMKAQVKAQNDTAKASEYIASELDRVNRLTESGGNITSAVNNKLIKFEQALKQSGQTAAQQVVALEKYKASLLSIQKASGNRQIDYLSRALGPQITDIGVGLMTGQAPLTILLQQGGQLRDQFALAGVAGSEMGKMLVQASKAMVVSIKDIGLAVGQLVTGAIAGTGKAIVNGIIAPFKRLSEGREALKQLEDGLISNLRYTRLLEVANGRLTQSVVAMGKVAGTVALIGVGMLAKGLYDVIKQQDQLTTQLVLTGASLGVNTAQATSYANSLNAVGVTTNSALKVIAAMAKEGGFLANEITMVVTAANNLKFAGVAIEDTVKQFAKLKEKPVEALIEIARATGLVKPEIVALVSQLEQQGKTSQAAAVAMKAYADVTVAQKDRLKNELSGFAIFMKTLSSSIGEFFDEVFRGLWRKASPTEAIKREIKELENTIKLGTQASPQTKARNEATLSSLKEQLRLSQLASDAETTRSSDNIRAAKALGEWQQLSVANLDKEKKAELDIANIRKVGLEAKKSEAEIEKLIAAYREKNKPAKVGKQTKELTDAEKERIAFLKVMSDLEDRAAGFTKNYSDQLNMLNIGLVEGWISQDEFNIKLQELNKIQPGVIKAHKDRADALAKMTEAQKKADDALFDSLDVEHALNMQILEQTDLLMLQRSLIGSTDAERKKSLATKRLDLQLEKEIADINKRAIPQSEKDAQIARATKRRLDAEKNVNTEIANDFVEKQLAEYNKISDGLTDAAMTGLFEGGKAGSKKLRDLIVAELKKPIKIVIDAVINATLGSFINSLIGGAAGSSFAGGAAGSAATGGISGMSIGGATLGAQAGAFGQGVASGFSFGAPVSSMGSATSASFNAGATYGAPVAGALGGMYANRAISNGFEINKTLSTIQDVATIAAAFVPVIGPILALGTGAVSGIVNRTFGRKLTDVGIRGTLGGETGFEGERYTFEKGGFLRSNKTRTSQLEEADRSAIASTFRIIKTSVMELAESAGFGSDAIKNFTTQFQINLKGLSPEDAIKKFQEEFAKIEESMAQAVIGTSGYRRENETNLQALVRISSFMGGINDAFKKLGFETYKLELASLDAAQSFVDLFGGIEGFSKAMGFFYDNFFTDAEKIENLSTDLTTAFGKLGLELPNTREEFRALVRTAQKAGDATLVKNLLDLQYGFAELVPVTETITDVIDEVIVVMTKNMQELLKERANLEVQLLQVQGRTDEANAALRRIATEGFTDAEIAAYDYNENLKVQIESYKTAAELAKKLADFTKQRSNLEVELLRVQGRTQEADIAAHALATEGMSKSEIAAYDYNEMLRTQIDYLKMLKDAADAYAQVVKGLADEQTNLSIELLRAQGRTTEANAAIRALATGAMQPAEVAAYDYNNTLRDQIQSYIDAKAAADAYAERVKGLADEQTNLNIELLKVQGRTTEANAALRALAIEGLEETEVAAYDYNNTLRDQIDLTQKLNDYAKEKSELEIELLRAQGRNSEAEAAAYALATAGMQEAEVAAYDYNQSLRAQIKAYGDLKTTTDNTFEAVKKSIENTIVELEKSFSATDTALSNVEKSISAEKELAKIRLDSALEQEQAIKAVFDVLKKSIADIRGATIGGAVDSKGLIASAIQSGRLPDAGALSDAISDVKSSIDSTAFVSMVDQKRASLLFANQLEELQKIAEPQLSSAEQAVILAQENIDILDANLKVAQEQVSILRGIDVGILSVSQALNALYSAMTVETSARTQIGNLNTELQTATEQYNTLRNVDTSIVPLVTALLNFQAALTNETDNIVSPSLSVPSASLNVASTYSATQGTAVTQSASSTTVLELQALRAELTLLRSETVATALNTGKTARILDRATQENGAILVVSEA